MRMQHHQQQQQQAPHSSMKRHRVKRASRAANCSDSVGQGALASLRARLDSIRIEETTTADTAGAAGNSSSSSSKQQAQAPRRPMRPAGAPTTHCKPGQRPHHVKPLALQGKLQPLAHASGAGAGAGVAGNGCSTGSSAGLQSSFAEPTRPTRPGSATLRRPSILVKRQRRTKSASTRRESAKPAAMGGSYVPPGMIVSLPPLLPTHAQLKDAYSMGFYDDGAAMVDTDDEMDWADLQLDDAYAQSVGRPSSAQSEDRPSVVVDTSFVQDMLLSLDDSLEEAGFRAALAAVAAEQSVASAGASSASATDSGSFSSASFTASAAPAPAPLSDSPILFDNISPSCWGVCASPSGFGTLPMLESGHMSL